MGIAINVISPGTLLSNVLHVTKPACDKYKRTLFKHATRSKRLDWSNRENQGGLQLHTRAERARKRHRFPDSADSSAPLFSTCSNVTLLFSVHSVPTRSFNRTVIQWCTCTSLSTSVSFSPDDAVSFCSLFLENWDQFNFSLNIILNLNLFLRPINLWGNVMEHLWLLCIFYKNCCYIRNL